MNQRAGLLLLLAAALVIGGYLLFGRAKHGNTLPEVPDAAVAVTGYAGGEKLGFLQDAEILKIFHDKYGITVNATKMGSVEMAAAPAAGQDFFWPSSQVALELYKEHGGKSVQEDTVFSSPLVLYSWDSVTDALVKAKVVRQVNGSYYIVDFPRLIRLINQGTQWKEIGLTDLYGRMTVRSTDPAKSNSGMMFAGLLANAANHGEVATDATIPSELPGLKTFFGRLGYQEDSSGDLFNHFLKLGEGENPIIVGYENQLTEFSIENPSYQDVIRRKIRILYPQPTVWATHPFIALDDKGARLLKACQDPDVQRLAWEHHGFRSGIIGAQNDPKVLQVVGIPADIQNVMPMPTAHVMNTIVTSLSTH